MKFAFFLSLAALAVAEAMSGYGGGTGPDEESPRGIEIEWVSSGKHCSNFIGLSGQGVWTLGGTLADCGDLASSYAGCTGEYFQYNSGARDCGCATDACSSRTRDGNWAIYQRTNPCDAREVIANADDAGSCTANLASGATCTQTGNTGFTCTASSCSEGTLTAGTCSGGITTRSESGDGSTTATSSGSPSGGAGGEGQGSGEGSGEGQGEGSGEGQGQGSEEVSGEGQGEGHGSGSDTAGSESGDGSGSVAVNCPALEGSEIYKCTAANGCKTFGTTGCVPMTVNCPALEGPEIYKCTAANGCKTTDNGYGNIGCVPMTGNAWDIQNCPHNSGIDTCWADSVYQCAGEDAYHRIIATTGYGSDVSQEERFDIYMSYCGGGAAAFIDLRLCSGMEANNDTERCEHCFSMADEKNPLEDCSSCEPCEEQEQCQDQDQCFSDCDAASSARGKKQCVKKCNKKCNKKLKKCEKKCEKKMDKCEKKNWKTDMRYKQAVHKCITCQLDESGNVGVLWMC